MHVVAALATVEEVGEEEPLVFEESIPEGGKTEGGVNTQHGLEVIVATVSDTFSLHTGTNHPAHTQHGIYREGMEEVVIIDVEEGGVDIPQEFGAPHQEKRTVAAAVLVVAGGHHHVETETER